MLLLLFIGSVGDSFLLFLSNVINVMLIFGI